MRDPNDIKSVEGEAGVIATIIQHPEFTFRSEHLRYTYFTDQTNGYIYWAVQELAKRDIKNIDAYNIQNILSSNKYTSDRAKEISLDILNDIIANSEYIARESVEDYLVAVNNVVDAAMRRDTVKKLRECERLCFTETEENLEESIYKTLDDVMIEFSTTSEAPPLGKEVDKLWAEIEQRQDGGLAGAPFKFPALNEYATIDRGELFIFAAEQKQGKSMMLLNCAVDLLRQGKAVLYIDSELNTRLFLCRLISHLTTIEFKRIRSGRYDDEERKKIEDAKNWIKSVPFTHIYLPSFDPQTIYTVTKKVKHTQGLDVLIVDYFKSSNDTDAFATYAELGKLTDLVKNKIAGDMDIAAVGAVQATTTGKIADSAKIARNASTIALIQDKTIEEIQRDGKNCGNKKLRVVFNRNGAQMSDEDYIDLTFWGNYIRYEQADQHARADPY